MSVGAAALLVFLATAAWTWIVATCFRRDRCCLWLRFVVLSEKERLMPIHQEALVKSLLDDLFLFLRNIARRVDNFPEQPRNARARNLVPYGQSVRKESFLTVLFAFEQLLELVCAICDAQVSCPEYCRAPDFH